MLNLSAAMPITCAPPCPGKCILKISATLQPLLDTPRQQLPSLLKQLQVGQLLQAKVLTELQPGLVRLQIATTELLARTQVTLQPGTRLNLEVVRGHPQPELRVLQHPPRQEGQQQAVRSAIVRQLPPADVRQVFDALRAEVQTPRQSDGVRQFTAILQDSGVRLNQLHPANLQRAVVQSGLFHEARLAGAMPLDTADAKTRLLQLLTLLKNDAAPNQKIPPPSQTAPEQMPASRDPGGDSLINRLMRLVESSVSRIQLQQAAALPVEEGQRQAWQIDLPVHLPDETHDAMLRIEREAADKDNGEAATWAVNLAFQFDTIGTLQTRIALAGERVSATFWCERDSTQRVIEQRLPNLKEAFEAQGLEVAHLAGVHGEPTQPLIKVPMPETLLDERA